MVIPVYVGDSASLSYLQLIRMIVESISGPSQFTMDPSRHKLMENMINLPPNIRTPHILPDRETANILVESYFTNVSLTVHFTTATYTVVDPRSDGDFQPKSFRKLGCRLLLGSSFGELERSLPLVPGVCHRFGNGRAIPRNAGGYSYQEATIRPIQPCRSLLPQRKDAWRPGIGI
jgi:hypothetical protein